MSDVVVPARLEFRILGSVEVLIDGVPRALAGTRQRVLLAMLLVHAGEVVSTGRLTEALWGEDAPATATKSLQVHVSRLRRDLGLPADPGPGARLLTQAPGYVLQVEAEQLDLARFEELAARGRRALDDGDEPQAARLLREALALWRGDALADLALEPVAAAAGPRLEEQRLAAVEDRIDADLACGDPRDLIGELQRLVDAHPLRERLRAQLMLALYRAGRQADALSAYQDARRTLVGDLGLEPGPRLRELERAILEQDETLLGAGPPPRPAAVGAAPPGRPRGRPRRGLLVAAAVGAVAIGVAVVALAGGDDPAAEADRTPPRIVGNTLLRIDARTGAVKTLGRVGKEPGEVLATRGRVWVANEGDRTLSTIALDSGRVETVKGLPGVRGLAATPLGGVFVSSFVRHVFEIPDATLTPRRVVTLPGQAEGLAVGAGSLWITSPATERGAGTDRVVRWDGTSARITQRVRVGDTPMFASFGYGRLWVANYDADTVSVVAPGRGKVRTIPVGDGPLGIAAGEGGVWVVNFGTRDLWRLDPVTGRRVARIPVGAGPLSVAAGGGHVWVTNRESATVQQIDPATNRVTRTIDVNVSPTGIAAAEGAAFVAMRSAPY